MGSGERWRHEAELEMVRASRSRRRFGDYDEEDWERIGAGGFDGQQRIRMELEALRTNRRRMMQEEEEDVGDEETKMSERDRIQGGQTGFNSTVGYHLWLYLIALASDFKLIYPCMRLNPVVISPY